MSHFAKVENGIVTDVIVAEQDVIDSGLFGDPSIWIQTSYNTFGNQHKLGGTPLRGNYAGVGYTYDKENDVFYSSQPYPSWVLNTSTWLWDAPYPAPVSDKPQVWDEASLQWISIELPDQKLVEDLLNDPNS